MLERIDKILVNLELVSSRNKASELIKNKSVYYQNNLVARPSFKLSCDAVPEDFRIEDLNPFVGRGAHKVRGAISYFQIEIKNKVVADVGACTGGFTDYVLQNGAKFVYAIDVGHGQLAKKLIGDTRVQNLEGVNIRYGIKDLLDSCDIAVVDLSFISLKLVLHEIFNLVKRGGQVIALVKPQFEVGKSGLGKNGLVKNDKLREACLIDLFNFCTDNQFFIKNIMTSVIEGKKSGNIEYFFHLEKGINEHVITAANIENIFNKYDGE